MDALPRTPQSASKDEEALSAQPLLGDSSEDDGCVWTPAPASEAESSENGLPSPSTQQFLTVAASQPSEASTPLPVDPCKCKARTWKRALLPHLPQCSQKPYAPYEFCKKHLQNLPYGRYDNPLDPTLVAKIGRSLKRQQRKLRSVGIVDTSCSSKRKPLGVLTNG